MKIRKLYMALVGILMSMQLANAQQNMYVVGNNGKINAISVSSVDYATFNANDKLFTISNDGIVSTTTNSITATCSVGLSSESNAKTLSVTPEVGVCYSKDNTVPTIEDDCLSLGSELKSYTFTLESLMSGTTYYFRTYVKWAGDVFYGEVAKAKPPVDKSKIINGHKFVDLGLPSGLLWAETNIGADEPMYIGKCYAWGETSPKDHYSDSYFDSNYTTYSIDGMTTLEKRHDAAYVNWGASCRMPTNDEFEELINSEICTWTWTRSGNLVTSLKTGNCIFLPATGFVDDDNGYIYNRRGYYWSSTLHSSNSRSACSLKFSGSAPYLGGGSRRDGLAVRPVADYVTSKVNDGPFIISNDGIESTTMNSITATCSVGLSSESNVKTLSVTPEVGVCYSKYNSVPTIDDDDCLSLGSELKSYTFTLKSLTSGTTYYFRTYVKLASGVFYGDVDNAKTPAEKIKTINGHRFVDLGLPSGLLWAETNIGAEKPADDGNYYAWGETSTKSTYSSNNYFDSDHTTYSINGKTTLEKQHDAAYVNWGDSCRMPTSDEFAELSANCGWNWTSITTSDGSSIKGYKLISVRNGNSIFLPASGYRNNGSLYFQGSFGEYWSSTLHSSNSDRAYHLYFDNSSCSSEHYDYRYNGRTVRPVAEP